MANILSVEGVEPAAQTGVKGWFARRTQTEGGIAAFFVGPALLLMVLLNI